jgi:hypothetical protein
MGEADMDTERDMTEAMAPESAGSRRGLVLVASAALLLWLWVTLPLAFGQQTFYFRDVLTTHLPWKAFGASALHQGSIPAVNPGWALGQPFRGNPNVLPFYPGNLLYLLLPFWSAFNLHYALHWLLAGVAMAALARTLGQAPASAFAAGLTYAGSGWILSCLTFYNLLAVSAWWPLVLLGAVRGGRRGIAIGGIACGMALLGGEPVITTLGIVPLLLSACDRHGLRRGISIVLRVGATGLLIALPQIVASARILGFTSRTMLGSPAGDARFHFEAARFLELIAPFPFGYPWSIGKSGYWSWSEPHGLPYILTLHMGIVAAWLALLGARRARAWAFLAAGGLVLAWAGGLGGDAFSRLSGGLVRYPEKLLFWFALAVPLLTGWGLERVLATPRLWRWAAAGAGIAAAGAATVFALGPRLIDWLAAGRVPLNDALEAAPLRLGMWIVALLLAAAFLGLAAMAVRRGSGAGVVAAQLVALLPLAGLVATEPVEIFAPSPWARLLGPGTQVVTSNLALPLGKIEAWYELPDDSYLTLVRLGTSDLEPASGVRSGLKYPLARDLDGLSSPFAALIQRNLPRLDWDTRTKWFRVLGVNAAVLDETPATASLRLLATRERFGGTSRLFAVRAPAPAAYWPRSVATAASPAGAFRDVSLEPDPVLHVRTDRPLRHHPGASVRMIQETPDRIEVMVSGGGGLLVLRRAYQPLYRASTGGRALATLSVNLALLGVEVPPGTHRVRIEVAGWPEKLAGGVSLAGLIVMLALAWRR